jgi:hypothetical protein
MPLLRSRTAVHRARFRAVLQLFTTLAVVLTLLSLIVVIVYFWQRA